MNEIDDDPESARWQEPKIKASFIPSAAVRVPGAGGEMVESPRWQQSYTQSGIEDATVELGPFFRFILYNLFRSSIHSRPVLRREAFGVSLVRRWVFNW